ncbi:MAG: CPBP family intramembrane metalloprotease [Propionibacteriaceae bacterium]|jgi:membrane protease YdiL (CAAX protease family)|nr:CPBP family intramembrane metalloprotease [Propionibacteriaceae bacterium]
MTTIDFAPLPPGGLAAQSPVTPDPARADITLPAPVTSPPTVPTAPATAPAPAAVPASTLTPTKAFGRMALAATVFVLVGSLAGGLLSGLVGGLAPDSPAANWAAPLLAAVGLYGVAFPLALLVLRSLPDTVALARLPQPRTPSPLAFAVLVLAALGASYACNWLTAGVQALVAHLTGFEMGNALVTTLDAGALGPNLALVLVAAPLVEEFLFRRTLYRKLACFGPKVFIFYSAALFGLMHSNFFQIGYAFLLGVALAGLVWWTGRSRLNVAAHMLYNLLGGGMALVLASVVGDGAATAWGVGVMLAGVAALIVAVGWLVRHRHALGLTPGAYPAPRIRAIVTTPGFLVFAVVVLFGTVSNLLWS